MLSLLFSTLSLMLICTQIATVVAEIKKKLNRHIKLKELYKKRDSLCVENFSWHEALNFTFFCVGATK